MLPIVWKNCGTDQGIYKKRHDTQKIAVAKTNDP